MSFQRISSHPWLLFQDVVGGAHMWPRFLRNYFFCAPLNYKNRCVIASFAYINGASVDLLIDTLKRINVHWKPTVQTKLIGLYKYWDDEENGFLRRSRYFAFNIHFNKVLDLNFNERKELIKRYHHVPVLYQC